MAWHILFPQLPNRRALYIGEEGAKAEEEVYGDDAEPHEATLPALREAQEGYGEGCFAPGGGRYREHSSHVGHEEVGRPVGDVPAMLAETIVDVYRQRGGLGYQSRLNIGVRPGFLVVTRLENLPRRQ